MIDAWKHPEKEVTVALVGKYIQLHDAYISVVESLKHGGVASRASVNIKWIDSETVTAENVGELLGDVSGILVPGGFGSRGIEGKIRLSNTRVSIRFRSWACVLACSFPSWNLPAM